MTIRKVKDYQDRLPWHDMPCRVLKITFKVLSGIARAATAKVAVHFDEHDREMYQKLYPNNEPIQFPDTPIQGCKFAHAYVQCFESRVNTGEILRVAFC